ncbi:hypothetical protein FPZ42_06265 [Mucilaginibacter achroorhodeus]|uniref:Mechanosensitive ion channel protein MscS n=1 Tax=Mucilaginibacter achroorhodeus TaxID=2599294 RepID=A0A563U5N0_9SPHI|nr:hypothetical protein [Mucilaginibacter achroorhodeus]TWR26641.1 hypothetical protein FPZ42_06265 [Mucilaginibacter achroorhodeus]
MNWSNFIADMQDLHFRKVFFLVVFIAAGILLLLKYRFLRHFDRRENLAHRILRRTLDVLIPLVFALIAISSVAFWISGNN